MSNYSEKALANHAKGYNCAQAVICAFSDKIGIDEATLYKLSEGFGAGMGNRKNACGALSGAVMLAGLVSSNGDLCGSTKSSTYKLAGKIADLFEAKCLATTCEDIKGLKSGTPTVSCDECIRVAADVAEEVLFG